MYINASHITSNISTGSNYFLLFYPSARVIIQLFLEIAMAWYNKHYRSSHRFVWVGRYWL